MKLSSRIGSPAALVMCILIAAMALAADVSTTQPVAPAPVVAPPVPPAKPPGLPQLIVTDGDQTKPLVLSKVDIATTIDGWVAQTTEILTFRNDADRVLEGNLEFPLPPGATVCGFGLDVDGQIVDGVPVPKEKARITFEKEERKGIDPGLLEQTAGNNFRTRVYPIPAHGTRTIKVQFVDEVRNAPFGDDAQLRATYRLPMRWSEPIAEFHIRVDVIGTGQAPEASGLIGATFTSKDAAFVLDETRADVRFDNDLVIAVPSLPDRAVLVDQRTHAIPTIEQLQAGIDKPDKIGELAEPEYYFAIHDTVPTAPPINRPWQPVDRIAVVWDAGLTRAGVDKSRDLDALRMILQRSKAHNVELIALNNVATSVGEFTPKDGKYDALFDAIDALKYDGGVDLSKLSSALLHDKCAFVVMFTDGLASLGKSAVGDMHAPVYALTSAARNNFPLLQHIATASGGAAFNLIQTSADDAGRTIAFGSGVKLMAVDFNDKEIADVYPKGQPTVSGTVTIAGRLIGPTATIKLNYGCEGEVFHTESYTLSRDKAAETGIGARLWAQMKLADLEIQPAENADAISELGRQFNLVTSNTSLLVLENVQQYLTYRIVPPKNREAIFNQFVAQIKQVQAGKEKSREQRLTEVENEWNERLAWWNTDYKQPKDELPHVTSDPTTQSTTQASTQPTQVYDIHDLVTDPPAIHGTFGLPPRSPSATPPAMHQMSAQPDAAKKIDGDSSSGTGPQITIAPWNPNTPYLIELTKAEDQAYDVYLEQREKHGQSPAFFLDCADYFFAHKQPAIGVRILTNIAALNLDNPELLRIAGYRFSQIGQHDLAVDLFEKVLRMRPEERQSYRDLALAMEGRASHSLQHILMLKNTDDIPAANETRLSAYDDYNRALHLLNEVVIRPADQYPGIEVIALEESNAILKEIEPLTKGRDFQNPIDARFLKLMDLDVRVIMSWDTNDTDIDLWVTEPTGEKCFYSHNRTAIGGMISNDITTGYGPEEYNLRRAMPGKYVIQANFYGSRSQQLTGPTTIHCTVITHWGRDDEKRESLTVRLVNAKDVVDIGVVTVGDDKEHK